MATYLCRVPFEIGERWVEQYFDVNPHDESKRPIVTLAENRVGGEMAEVFARYRTTENGFGATSRCLAIFVRFASPAPIAENVEVTLFFEGTPMVEAIPFSFDGYKSKTSGV